MPDVSNILDNVAQTMFIPKVEYFLGSKSPVWQTFISTSNNVVQTINNDWTIQWPIRLGMSGSVRYSGIRGPDIATSNATGTPPSFQVYQDLGGWGSLDEHTIQGFQKRSISMKRMLVDFPVSAHLLQQMQSKVFVGDHMDYLIESVAENVAYNKANAFYSGSVGSVTGIICSFSTPGAGTLTIDSGGFKVTGTATPLEIDNTTSGAIYASIQKLEDSLAVDVYNHNGGSPTLVNTSGPLYIVSPDPLGAVGTTADTEGEFQIVTVGSYAVSLATSTLYHVALRGASGFLPNTLDDIIQGDGGTVYGLSTDTYTKLKSLRFTYSSPTTISEVELAKVFARMRHAKQGLNQVTHLCGGEGVFSAFFQAMLALGSNTNVRFEHNGSMIQVKSGVAESVTFNLFGRSYGTMVDGWFRPKSLYGLNLAKGNFQVLRPPKTPKAGSHPRFQGQLEFVIPILLQLPTIFFPYLQVGGGLAGQVTPFSHAPAWEVYQIMAKDPVGFFLGNLTEAYL